MPVRRVIAKTLSGSGWEIVGEAVDGEDAIAKYERLRPDAVTLDIMMPKTDGLAVLRRIIGLDPNARVVIVSVLDQTAFVSKAMALGARAFVTKPFMRKQLEAGMAKCLENTIEV